MTEQQLTGSQGSYLLKGAIARGGNAVVFDALDQSGHPVAVKLLSPGAQLVDPAIRRRFEREIQILGQLQHPRLIELVDWGHDHELGPFLVTSRIEGRTLRQLSAEGSLGPESTLALMIPLLRGLGELHRAGVVHRDIKPENVMIDHHGQVVLIDLGLVQAPEHTSLTAEEHITGSIQYMSPERIEGGRVGPAADVWAVGIMIYEFCSGKRPFARATPSEEMAAVLVGAYRRLELMDSRVSNGLSAIVGRCLQAHPESRPQDADALASLLLAEVDWCAEEELSQEVGLIARDGEAFQRQVTSRRTAMCREAAWECLATGHEDEALRHLDRALAYSPADNKTLALVERARERYGRPNAVSGAATHAASPRGNWRSLARWGPRIVTVLAVAVLALGIYAFVSRGEPGTSSLRDKDKQLPTKPVSQAPKTQLRSQAPPDRQQKIPTSKAAPPMAVKGAQSTPVTGLELLSREALERASKPRELEQISGKDEPLVDPSLLLPETPQSVVKRLNAELEKNPDNVDLKFGRAMALMASLKTQDQGRQALDDLVAANPDRSIFWESLGYLAARVGDGARAEHLYSKAVELDPSSATALRNRGIVRSRRGRLADGYADLIAALRIDPGEVEALKELANIYSELDQEHAAHPLLVRLSKLRPRDPVIWLDLSVTEVEPAAALRHVERARALAPNLPRVHQLRCHLFTKVDPREAIAACGTAIELVPGDAGNYMYRGLAWYFLGNDQNALKDMGQAIDLDSTSSNYFTNRYLVHAHAGNDSAATKDLKEACRLGGTAACTELQK